MANKINDTSLFPIQADPADDDLLLGTDVSDVSNDPGGQTVNFRVDTIQGGPKLLQTLSPGGSNNEEILSFDNTKFNSYLVVWENLQGSGSNPIAIRLSTDNGSSTVSSGYLGYTSTNDGSTITAGTETSNIISIPQVSGKGTHGQLWIHSTEPTDTSTFYHGSYFQKPDDSAAYTIEGHISAVGSHNAVVFGVFSTPSQLLNDGTIRLYGVRG
jgi:hypothetical protein